MDLPVTIDRAARPLSTSLIGLALRIEQFIGSGGRAVVIIGPPGSGKLRLADAVLSGLPGRQTRIANPAPGPLSMKRMLHQIGMPSDEGTDGPFFGMLAEQAYEDPSAAVAVGDAHTLSPYALSALSRVPGLGGPEHPGMLLFLVGEAPLLAKLSAPGLEVLRNARRTLVLTMPASGATVEAGTARLTWTSVSAQNGEDEHEVGTVRGRRPSIPIRRTAKPVVAAPPSLHRRPVVLRGSLVMLAVALSIAIVLGWMAWPEPVRPPPAAQAVEPVPNRSSIDPLHVAPDRFVVEPRSEPPIAADLFPPEPAAPPAPPVAEAVPPPDVAVPAPEPTPAQIKREFDAFLNRAGRDTAKLTPAARAALFREYLQWRIRAALAGP